MTEAMILADILREHLIMNAARIFFIACFINALIKVRTVNLKEIAVAFPGSACNDSQYRKIQRFFKDSALDLSMIARLTVELSPIKNEDWVLTIDRTNWKYGKFNINILTLGIAYKGIAFPLVWFCLDKRGNSNTKERIKLTDRHIEIFGADKIRCLTADREFIGTEWFRYLLNLHISFCIRIKDNFLVANSRGIPVPAKTLFRDLKIGESKILEGCRTVLGHQLYIIGMLLPDGEYLILVTDKDPETAIDDYKLRWGIETLFGCLKTWGFNFEDTRMTSLPRIEKLVGLLAIAFCLCHNAGEQLNELRPISIKKHGRKAISIFRYGLDEFRGILLNIANNINKYKIFLRILFQPLDISFILLNKP